MLAAARAFLNTGGSDVPPEGTGVPLNSTAAVVAASSAAAAAAAAATAAASAANSRVRWRPLALLLEPLIPAACSSLPHAALPTCAQRHSDLSGLASPSPPPTLVGTAAHLPAVSVPYAAAQPSGTGASRAPWALPHVALPSGAAQQPADRELEDSSPVASAAAAAAAALRQALVDAAAAAAPPQGALLRAEVVRRHAVAAAEAQDAYQGAALLGCAAPGVLHSVRGSPLTPTNPAHSLSRRLVCVAAIPAAYRRRLPATVLRWRVRLCACSVRSSRAPRPRTPDAS